MRPRRGEGRLRTPRQRLHAESEALRPPRPLTRGGDENAPRGPLPPGHHGGCCAAPDAVQLCPGALEPAISPPRGLALDDSAARVALDHRTWLLARLQLQDRERTGSLLEPSVGLEPGGPGEALGASQPGCTHCRCPRPLPHVVLGLLCSGEHDELGERGAAGRLLTEPRQGGRVCLAREALPWTGRRGGPIRVGVLTPRSHSEVQGDPPPAPRTQKPG